MNLSGLFIRRPVATTLTMLSILLAGAIGYRLLPVSDLPNVDFPTIQVAADLPGASPETMASSVATLLEKQLSSIPGVDSMSSSSAQGETRITLQFVLSRNIDAAAQDVQSALARIARKLPSTMSEPPSYRKVNPADLPILYLSLVSANLPMSELDEWGENMLAQQISQVDGVAQVMLYGAQKYAVRVELDPRTLAARGIGIDQVADSIGQHNVNMPLGNLNGPNKVASIQANGQLTVADHYRPLIVAYRNGQPVRLGELGKVIDSYENDKEAAWFGTAGKREPAFMLAVQKQPGTNTVEVANAVKQLLPKLREKMPASVSLSVLRDNSVPIMDSTRDVQFTLLLTLVLVVLVIFLFLRNLSATIIPSLALPMSIVGTFAVMYLLNYSLDNLSLMALTLSVGFVVDDAIVMLENIVRHLETGKTRMDAAFDGAREVGFTIVSMTLSLAAVFIPVLLMGGIVGRLFREFSVTIGVAVLVSGVVSLTLTPMLCSRFLRDPRAIRHGFLYRLTENAYDAMVRFYDWSLVNVLRHGLSTVAVSLLILGGSIYLFITIPKGFIPSEDRDQIQINSELAQDLSFKATVEHQLKLADIVAKDPNVDRYLCQAELNTGRMLVVLKPRSERQLSADEVIAELRPKLARVPGIRASLINPLTVNVGGRQSRSLYQLTLLDSDTRELYAYAGTLEQKIQGLPDFLDVSSDMELKNPQLNVEINRDQAATMDVSPRQIETALYAAYGTQQVSTIYSQNNTYQVIMQVLPEFQTDPTVLSMLYVRSSSGQLVPLKTLTKQSEGVGALQVNHSGQLPSVTITFNLKPGVSLGDAINEVNDILYRSTPSIPKGMTASFQGTAQAFQSSLAGMGWLLLGAVVVIYVVLGILYESFFHPFTIITALPFAGFGALLTLLIFHCDLNLYAYIGLVMLVGLVKKNGIIMIDFAIQAQRAEGKSARDAIHEACIIRFRPIMMTTMAALMAGLPIALGWGAGAESRRPLGLAVVGGLLFSQTLTLYVTPVFYLYMEKFRMWVTGPAQREDSSAPDGNP